MVGHLPELILLIPVLAVVGLTLLLRWARRVNARKTD
jgi:hypothetical protein